MLYHAAKIHTLRYPFPLMKPDRRATLRTPFLRKLLPSPRTREQTHPPGDDVRSKEETDNHLTHRRHMIGPMHDASRRPLREPATGSGTRLTGHSRDPPARRMRRTSRRVAALGSAFVYLVVTIGVVVVVVGGAVLAGCSRSRGGDRCPRGFLSRAAAAGRTRRVAQPLARP